MNEDENYILNLIKYSLFATEYAPAHIKCTKEGDSINIETEGKKFKVSVNQVQEQPKLTPQNALALNPDCTEEQLKAFLNHWGGCSIPDKHL